MHDRDTELVHFGYREYDPYTGKWTAKDPIGFDGGDANLYGYVLRDPVDFVDPTGKISISEITLGILSLYLAIDTLFDWYDYLTTSKELCDDNEKPINTPEDYLKYRDNVQKQLNNSRDIGKETTNDVLKAGYPLSKPLDTLQSGGYEFGK